MLRRLTMLLAAAVLLFVFCNAGGAQAEKEIPKTRLSQNSQHLPTGGPTITIHYW